MVTEHGRLQAGFAGRVGVKPGRDKKTIFVKVSPEDIERFQRENDTKKTSPTLESSNLVSSTSSSVKKKSVSILLTMPSTDIDDDAEKTLSHCATFQTSDPQNRHHILPSKSGISICEIASDSQTENVHKLHNAILEFFDPVPSL